MKKYYIAIVVLAITALFGCSDDHLLTNEIGSALEEGGDYKISYFDLSNETIGADESLRDVTIILKPEEGLPLEYPADIDVSAAKIKCKMRIPKNETLPDGNYILSIRLADGSKLGGKVSVVFKDEMLHSSGSEMIEYTKLSGDGTADSPYIIKSKDDFTAMINNLRRDSTTHGAGRHFKQTATFNAPTQSELYDGRGYYNYGFAGIYDGGGFAIENIYYVGNKNESKDRTVGLFAELFDGAEVKNLSLNDVTIQNTASDCGSIAGAAFGDVKISNVKVNGSITKGGSRCGGLIGTLIGTLTVDGYDLNVNVDGDSEVGGLLGQAYPTSIVNIHSVTTDDHRFTVSGTNNVGGLIGRINGEFHISRVELQHTVSTEDSDLKIIRATGKNGGGVIGYVEDIPWSSTSSLDSILIECPIGVGTSAAGGLAGYVHACSPLTINYCRMTSLVSGKDDVGGLFGYYEINGDNKVVFEGGDNLTRVVTDGTAAGVSGATNVGGLFGTLKGSLAIYSKINIATNIHGTGNNVGGAIGALDYSRIDLSNIDFTSSSMKVEGGGSCIGGVVGYSKDSEIIGPTTNIFQYYDAGPDMLAIPKPSQFTPTYIGTVTGKDNVGGIVGKMYNSSVKYVCAQCTVLSPHYYVGGIAGFVEFSNGKSNRLEFCIFKGTVKGTSDDTGFTGGIAGRVLNEGVIQYCLNYGTISSGGLVGGIIGSLNYSRGIPQVNWCVNTGNITSDELEVGGIVGDMYGGDSDWMTVYYCANYGEIRNNGGSEYAGVGGIVGICDGKKIRIKNCANHGKVSGSGRQHGLGGIAGSLGQDPDGVYAQDNLEIAYCCNRGEVNCSNENANLGGILGYQEEGSEGGNDSWLHDCINFGPITSSQEEDNGGILGKVDHYGRVENCVNFGKVKKGNGTVGTRKSSCVWHHKGLYYLDTTGKSWGSDGVVNDSNKGDQGKYPELNFSTTWIMRDGYPSLRDCKFQSSIYSAE